MLKGKTFALYTTDPCFDSQTCSDSNLTVNDCTSSFVQNLCPKKCKCVSANINQCYDNPTCALYNFSYTNCLGEIIQSQCPNQCFCVLNGIDFNFQKPSVTY